MYLVPYLSTQQDLQSFNQGQSPAAGYNAGNIDMSGHRVVLGLILGDDDCLTRELY